MIRVLQTTFSTASLLLNLGGCSLPGGDVNQAAQSAGKPGWTGRTFVVGSHSRIADDAAATELEQKWGRGGGGGGAGEGG